MTMKKVVYLITKRGPVAYTVDGIYITPADGAKPAKKRHRRTKAEMAAARAGGAKPAKKSSPRKPRPSEVAAKKARANGAGAQASL